MYRRSSKTSQLDLFSRADSLLKGKALKVYNDAEKWHNQFRIQVTDRIDGDLFHPLFHEDFGSPNAPIRILIGMMILKEARGWSDARLYEECNVLVDTADAADCDFLQTVIEETKEIVTGKIATTNADGAYHSPELMVLKHGLMEWAHPIILQHN